MMKIEIVVGENVDAAGIQKAGGRNQFKARAVTLIGADAEAIATGWHTGATRRDACQEALSQIFGDLQ